MPHSFVALALASYSRETELEIDILGSMDSCGIYGLLIVNYLLSCIFMYEICTLFVFNETPSYLTEHRLYFSLCVYIMSGIHL